MKKVTAVFIVLLLIMFSYTALAETQYGENPWTNENSKIYVFEDFSGTFEGEDWTKYPNYWSFAAYSGEDPLKGSVTNGYDVPLHGRGIKMGRFLFRNERTLRIRNVLRCEGLWLLCKKQHGRRYLCFSLRAGRKLRNQSAVYVQRHRG